jgi:hypothetical protein
MRRTLLLIAAAVAVLVVALLSFTGLTDGSGPGGAQARSRAPIGEDGRWRSYLEAPTGALVKPVRVVNVAGEVSDPDALARRGGGRTILTYAGGGRPPSLVLDYGQEVAGTPTFDVTATTATTLEATYSETLANLGHDGAETIALFATGNPSRTDRLTLTVPGAVRAPLVQGGERYERVTLTAPGTVTLRSAGIEFTPPRSALAGHFLSSDDLLNRIWYAGAYTLALDEVAPGTEIVTGAVNQLHLLIDGAKRDRAVWSGDQLIADLTAFYSSDPRYVRDSLALLAGHPATRAGQLTPATGDLGVPGPLPGVCSTDPQKVHPCETWSATYSILVVIDLYNYYLYTGDLALVRQYWPAVLRQMQWDAQQVDGNGLFAVDSDDDSDWNLERLPGELSYVNALYFGALTDAARLASALGDGSQASSYSAAARAVRRAVQAHLWDEQAGVYDASTAERGAVVQDANSTAVLVGLADTDQARRATGVMTTALAGQHGALNVSQPAPPGYDIVVSPYAGSANVLADFMAGDAFAALSLIRTEWGYMVAHDPGGVDWERIGLDGSLRPGSVADSAAHAWSTGPTAALSEYVLGVAPLAPGYAGWSVAPVVGGLSWAQGAVPTPRGPISVRWRTDSRGATFQLSVSAPIGATGSVSVPLLGAPRVIAEDGHIVWDGQRAVNGAHAHIVDGSVQFSAVTGRHTYAW